MKFYSAALETEEVLQEPCPHPTSLTTTDLSVGSNIESISKRKIRVVFRKRAPSPFREKGQGSGHRDLQKLHACYFGTFKRSV